MEYNWLGGLPVSVSGWPLRLVCVVCGLLIMFLLQLNVTGQSSANVCLIESK